MKVYSSGEAGYGNVIGRARPSGWQSPFLTQRTRGEWGTRHKYGSPNLEIMTTKISIVRAPGCASGCAGLQAPLTALLSSSAKSTKS